MGRSRVALEHQRYPALLLRPVRSILVIKPRAIGDVLLSTIVLPNLRTAFPEAAISFLTERASGDIIRDNPDVDHPIVFDAARQGFFSLLRQLRRARFDLVFDLFSNPRSAQMTFATGAPVRVGYPFRGRAWAYNVHVRTRADRVHNTEFNLDALAALDIPISERQLRFPLPEERRARMAGVTARLRRRSGPLVALNSSGTWESKRWGLDHFSALGDMLVARLDANVLLLWGPGEEQDVARIQAGMQHPCELAPPTRIGELGALLSQCDYTISNDSGPMHISAAVGTPTLGIFGPTNPVLQGPFGPRNAWVRLESLDCLACNLTRCPIGNICMRDLDAETVYSAFVHLMERHP
ncbi:MAG: glycosyltransferase family 9 protein [Bacteroidota bacterium]|jgi:ADP-heptose:LPS heptosyltransferase|nr:glycosyltransferase family 9 protein [Bacteroidota bacterium]